MTITVYVDVHNLAKAMMGKNFECNLIDSIEAPIQLQVTLNRLQATTDKRWRVLNG
jgi:hypothetical protein